MEAIIQDKVNAWLQGNYDAETKAEIERLQAESPEELTESFYKNLEFGTGGLRGIMGIGSNRMNKYTVGMATQGYANYLNQAFGNGKVSVVVGHDSRNNSRYFAEIVANVFGANNIKVYLFEALRPTPEISFAIRYLKCQGGVVLTASHNPKEYNGYKAYWDDGAQMVSPHDTNTIAEVEKIANVNEVRWNGGEQNISIIGKEMDDKYLEMVKGLSVYPEIIKEQHDLKIVYTPIHGTGIMLIPRALEMYGFTNVHVVKEQETPNGNFPTVDYPNPEERETMSLGLKLAEEIDADILIGTDPDTDRIGVGVKDTAGNWVLLNGNQTALIAFSYMIEARKAKGIAQPNDMVIKTIVTTDLIDKIAAANDVACYNVLTGFKWISSMIKDKTGKENYVIGGEESFGLMIGDQVRDKDAVSATCLLCEMAAVEKSKGRTLYEKLLDIYAQYGFYKENLVSITKKGMNGAAEIARMMEEDRANPPREIGGQRVVKMHDYETQQSLDLLTNETTPIDLPKSNVLQFILEDGTKISARPSGTEPKIKYYFSTTGEMNGVENFAEAEAAIDEKLKGLRDAMGL